MFLIEHGFTNSLDQTFSQPQSSETTTRRNCYEEETSKRSPNEMNPFDETVTEIVNFFFSNYPPFAINDLPKLKLLDQLLVELSSKFELSPTLPAAGSKKMNELMIRHFTTYIELSTKLFENQKFDEALDFWAVVEKHLTCDTNFKLLLSDVRFSNKIKMLRENSTSLKSKINGWKAFNLGSDTRKKAYKMTDLEKRHRIGTEALLQLKEARLLLFDYRQNHPDLWAQIHCEMGLVYLECLAEKRFAREQFLVAQRYYQSVKRPIHHIQPEWYSFVILGLERTKSPEESELEEILSEIKGKMELGINALINFALAKHPPKHSAFYDPRQWMELCQDVDKKLLLQLIRLYHTDKIDRNKFGQNYFRIAEEITKYLTSELKKCKKSK